jgi:hypothetical protein
VKVYNNLKMVMITKVHFKMTNSMDMVSTFGVMGLYTRGSLRVTRWMVGGTGSHLMGILMRVNLVEIRSMDMEFIVGMMGGCTGGSFNLAR